MCSPHQTLENPRRLHVLPAWLGRTLTGRDLGEIERVPPTLRAVAAGDRLYRQGDEQTCITMLLSGWSYREQYLADGRRQILEFLLPDTILGFTATAQASHGITMLTSGTISQFPRQRFFALMQQVPRLAVELVRYMSLRRAMTYEHITNLGQRSARERVAYLLCELFVVGRSHVTPGADGSMAMPITQPQIGDALGLSAVHVNRMLMGLRRDGIAALRDRRLVVMDLPRLAEEGGFDLAAAAIWDHGALQAA